MCFLSHIWLGIAQERICTVVGVGWDLGKWIISLRHKVFIMIYLAAMSICTVLYCYIHIGHRSCYVYYSTSVLYVFWSLEVRILYEYFLKQKKILYFLKGFIVNTAFYRTVWFYINNVLEFYSFYRTVWFWVFLVTLF